MAAIISILIEMESLINAAAKVINNILYINIGTITPYDSTVEKRKPRDVAQFSKKFPRHVYKFVPERVWIN
ncbi:hypothetical protein HY612_03785 [Candidatus Roizmanbacteria bacterium]|nr:hypothetical protein [Candidatus Roizmanbacteria bacterium]